MTWDTVRLDIRHTLRMARRSPGPAMLAVLALALGIGASTTIFTVVRGILLKPLPYAQADRLVVLWSHNAGQGAIVPVSPADYADLRRQHDGVGAIEAYFSFITNSALTLGGRAEVVASSAVTPGLFDLLGRRAALGRALVAGDPPDRVVISDGFWRRRFGSDPTIVGRAVPLDSRMCTIVGVMPPDFVFPYKGFLGPTGFTRTTSPDVWTALSMDSAQLRNAAGQLARNVRFLGVMARLEPGVTLEQARARVQAMAAALEADHPDTNKGWTFDVVPAHEQAVGLARPALLLLLGGVALLLLMACVNVANLVLARSVARQQELAVRAALGASRSRLATQAITEGLMLSGTGGALAILVASWGIRTIVSVAPSSLPRVHEVAPDMSVLAVSLLIAVACGLLVGLAPALAAGRGDVRHALQDGARGTAGLARHRLRSALAIAEVALAVLLAVGAGLLLRSFGKLLAVQPGFAGEHVLTLQMNLPDRYNTPDARRAFYATFFERMEHLPGVVAVGGTTRIPLGSTNVSTSVEVHGRPIAPAERPEVEFRRAMHDYFAAMSIPIVRGRAFNAEDGPSAPPVAIINQSMARRVFPNVDPIGQQVRIGPNPSGAWLTIVGVIGDVRHSSLEAEPLPELYVHYLQNPPVSPFVVFRASGNPADLAETVRRAARAIDPTIPLYDIRTMEDIRSASVAERRFLLTLVAAFGVLALILASVGVYGVLSLIVSERKHELGVRLALGAAPVRLMTMIIRDASRLAAAGVLGGLIGAAAFAPLISSQLFGVSSLDPTTFAAVAALLFLVAVLAAIVPARKAMRVDPIVALRSE